MIKEISIKYCDANEKYDIIVDGEWFGKHYTVEEAIRGLERDVMFKLKHREGTNDTNKK